MGERSLASEPPKLLLGNVQDGGTVDLLPVANLMADSGSKPPIPYSSLIVTMRLSRLVSEIFACDSLPARILPACQHVLLWRRMSLCASVRRKSQKMLNKKD